jgi:signal transduction histidine kinase
MVAGVQEIMRDSTEESKIAEMKDRFIYAVTDELLTPLTSIRGYLDLILSGRVGSVPKGVESNLRIVKRNADRLVRLTDELLDIQRLKTGSSARALRLNS